MDGKRKSKKQNMKTLRKERKARGLSFSCYKHVETIIAGKTVKPVSCQTKKCQNKCVEKFNEAERQTIFEHFWKLDNTCKRSFLIDNTTQRPVKRRYIKTSPCTKERSVTMAYFLPKGDITLQVCQKFILKTLDISQKFMHYTYTHRDMLNMPQEDKRGKKPSANKTPVAQKADIMKFIELLPAVPSHYNRANSKKKNI